MRRLTTVVLAVCGGLLCNAYVAAAEPDVLSPRVPGQEIKAAKALKNPLQSTQNLIAQGKNLYHGKGFCAACHGTSGRGITDVDTSQLKGALPTDFTSAKWQAARTDGEIFWVLQHGSSGTAMASFVPSVLNEQEAWQIILYLRALKSQ